MNIIRAVTDPGPIEMASEKREYFGKHQAVSQSLRSGRRPPDKATEMDRAHPSAVPVLMVTLLGDRWETGRQH